MNTRKIAVLASIVLMAGTVAGVGPASYDGNLQVNVEEQNLQGGETLNADISVGNTNERPIANAYLVVNIVEGGEAYYPSQKSNKNNVFHQEIIRDISLKAGNGENIEYSYNLPENLKSGDYRVSVYFKTNRTPVQGLPFIYSAPATDLFSVSGSGNFPVLEVSRTETFLTGTDKVVGDWDPDTLNFRDTMWPSLTGPVGVLTTDSMNSVPGEVVVQNHGSSAITAEVNVKVCKWDDTACSNLVDTVTKTVSVPSSGTSVPVSLDNPSRPEAYAVKISVSSGGKTHSIYRNRIIRQGNTSRIRKLSVNQPYVASGDKLSVGLVAGASADHYTDPAATGVQAHVTVETMDGQTLMDKTKRINRLSNANVFEQLYFNTTVEEGIGEFRVSAELSANGQVYDEYSYVVDYSEYEKSITQMTLESSRFTDAGLETRLCGKTELGAPASGDIQGILMKNGSIEGQKTKSIDGCSTLSFSNVSEGSYTLVANYGDQKRFSISAASQNEGPIGDNPRGLPLIPVAGAVIVLLVIGIALIIRGGSE